MKQEELDNLRKRVESVTRGLPGEKTIKEVIRANPQKAIEDGKKSRAKKIADGWQETEDGLLPFEEIKKAGMVWSERSKSWAIPAEEIISDGSDGTRAGTKVVVVTQQYLKWRENYYKTKEYNVDKAIEKVSIPEDQQKLLDNIEEVFADNIDVSKMKF